MQAMNEQNGREKTIILGAIVGALLLFGVFEYFQRENIKNRGVYVKGTIVNSEGYKGGIVISVKYDFMGRKYEGLVTSDLSEKAIGRQYFLQLRPEKPQTIVFLRHKPIPDCLLNVDAPPEGWKEVPECP